MLAPYFGQVAASDASMAQLRARTSARGVHYLAERGEASAIAGERVDLVTVPSLHWLDHQAFHAEGGPRPRAGRGAHAVWCYGRLDATPDIETRSPRSLRRQPSDPTGPPSGCTWSRPTGISRFPSTRSLAPASHRRAFTLAQLLGYVGSWSAVGGFIKAKGFDPVPELGRVLGSLWGNPETPKRIVWPIAMRGGRWRGAGARRR